MTKGTTMNRLLNALLLLGLAIALPATSGARAQAPASPIRIEHPWSRASAVATGVVYLTIANRGPAGDRLVAVASPVAEKAELHSDIDDNGVMKMRPLAAIEIKPNGKAVLKPGGMHIMLIGLKQPLIEGQSIPLSLSFEKAGKIDITVPVEKAGSAGDMPGMKM
jgi:periplasmic copper chaperone A